MADKIASTKRLHCPGLIDYLTSIDLMEEISQLNCDAGKNGIELLICSSEIPSSDVGLG